jgi:hypothetical protein
MLRTATPTKASQVSTLLDYAALRFETIVGAGVVKTRPKRVSRESLKAQSNNAIFRRNYVRSQLDNCIGRRR